MLYGIDEDFKSLKESLRIATYMASIPPPPTTTQEAAKRAGMSILDYTAFIDQVRYCKFDMGID